VENLGATHLTFEDNVGYARACNAAAAKSSSDHLALFNADCKVTLGALEDCCQALDDHPDWGVVGPRQIDDYGRLTHAGIFGMPTKPQHRAWLHPDSPLYADVQEAVTVSGAAYFVRRSVWDELTDCPIYRSVAPDAEGAFLPTPHFFEETWCSYHARTHGYKVFYLGTVMLIHRWHKASPVGGWAEQQFPVSQQIFRRACDAHGIEHD
jgi:GT2 family glycosyltransferase